MTDPTKCQEAFEARLDGDRSTVWSQHLPTCADCREQARALGLLLEPLRGEAPPALAPAERTAAEARFLEQIRGDPEPAETRPHGAGVLAWKVTALAAGLLLLLGAAWLTLRWLGDRGSRESVDPATTAKAPTQRPDPRPAAAFQTLRIASTAGRIQHRSASGVLAAATPDQLSPGARLETMEDQASAVLESPDRMLRLRLGPRSRLRRLAGEKRRLRLDRGELMVDVRSKPAGKSLAVHTAHGRVTVRGTRFRVQTGADRTRVTVLRGAVNYRTRAGAEHVVASGKQLVHDHAKVTIQAAPAMGPVPDMGPVTPSAMQPRPGCSVPRIRRLIRTGRARAARAAIVTCRKQGVHSHTATLLKMLDAQSQLALGQVGAAVRAYHRIARQHRGSRLGQNALFTAGQLELSRLGQRTRALRTFKRYLKTYPTGRYASEARQLVRTLEGGR